MLSLLFTTSKPFEGARFTASISLQLYIDSPYEIKDNRN